MGFLNWWQSEKHNEEPTSDSQQLDLLRKGNLSNRRRETGATVFRAFTDAIQANGGDRDAIRESIIVETQELFDCDVQELYKQTGGTLNDRSTLPAIVQRSYLANEALSAFELERMEGTIGGESQEENNDKIAGQVKDSSKRTRRWFPW